MKRRFYSSWIFPLFTYSHWLNKFVCCCNHSWPGIDFNCFL